MRLVATALITIIASSANAKSIDFLKAQLADCLRKENAENPAAGAPIFESRAQFILGRCHHQNDDLDFADQTRTDTVPSVSESTREVIESVFGEHNRDRILKPDR